MFGSDSLSLMSGSPNLDGRHFRDVTADHQGDVGQDTVFDYREEPDGVVHARYAGGSVRLGFLVGTRSNTDLEFRYSHVTETGEIASGYCRSRIECLEDGRLRMHERWEWTSKQGTGTSVIEELPAGW